MSFYSTSSMATVTWQAGASAGEDRAVRKPAHTNGGHGKTEEPLWKRLATLHHIYAASRFTQTPAPENTHTRVFPVAFLLTGESKADEWTGGSDDQNHTRMWPDTEGGSISRSKAHRGTHFAEWRELDTKGHTMRLYKKHTRWSAKREG